MDGVLLALRVLVSLAAVVGLLWLIARKVSKRPARDVPLRVAGRQSLGRRNGVAILAVGRRRLLVGYSDQQVTLLSELDSAPVVEQHPQGASVETAEVEEADRRSSLSRSGPTVNPLGLDNARPAGKSTGLGAWVRQTQARGQARSVLANTDFGVSTDFGVLTGSGVSTQLNHRTTVGSALEQSFRNVLSSLGAGGAGSAGGKGRQ